MSAEKKERHAKWIASRMHQIDSSGIRKVFDLAAGLVDPIDLSIGQPHFEVPEEVKKAAILAINQGKNGYTVTQGLAELRNALQEWVDQLYGHSDRQVFVTSGTSGGLVLALSALINPGDEVIIFDPSFVMYKHLVNFSGGKPIMVDTYPDFRIDLKRVQNALSDRTKCIITNSPANPTGAVTSVEETQGLAKLAQDAGVALISDEVYRWFCYDQPFCSPAQWNEESIVIDGFSKSWGMTGWRVGFVHGPSRIIQEMIKLQQFSFVCAPQPMQWAGVTAWQTDISDYVQDYRRKRDMMVKALEGDYDIPRHDGAFYLFPRVPWGDASTFVQEAIAKDLLIIPGNIFSSRDSHFRLSYATQDETLQRGIEVLQNLARKSS